MRDISKLDHAVERVDKAVAVFEAAAAKKTKSEAAHKSLQTEIEALRREGVQLAEQLDSATAGKDKLATANAQVSERLGAVMDNIRLLLSGV